MKTRQQPQLDYFDSNAVLDSIFGTDLPATGKQTGPGLGAPQTTKAAGQPQGAHGDRSGNQSGTTVYAQMPSGLIHGVACHD
jgi:hypothetical protein